MKKFIATSIKEFLNEQRSYNNDVWYHGTPNETLNFNIYSKGNQIPYGVHFTQNKDIAIDFANGSTKLRKTENANLFVCDINTDNSFDISKKHIFTEGDLYFNILNEIGIKSKIVDIINPTKKWNFLSLQIFRSRWIC